MTRYTRVFKFGFSILVLLIPVSFARSSSLVDPHIKILERMSSSDDRGGVGKGTVATVEDQGQKERVIGVFIKTSRVDVLQEFLRKKSGKVNSIIGAIVTAQIPVSIVSELEQLHGVQYVELAKTVHGRLNKSLPLIGAPEVHNGVNGGSRYTGNGVLVGIVDSGIDWKHSTFKGNDGKTRVVALWDQTLSRRDGFIGPAELVQTYGLECKKLDFDLDSSSLCPSRDLIGHGTHVAGIAAGGDSRYKGVAPDAQIIAVSLPLADEDRDFTPSLGEIASETNYLVDGVNYIFEKAQRLGKPAVVNLSLGMHFGPHDSTSLFEQALNDLVKAAPGRVIVAAAGNEANVSEGYIAGIHAGFSLNGEKRAVEFVAGSPLLHGIIIDVWQSQASNLSFGVGIDNYLSHQKTGMVVPGANGEFQSGDGRLSVLIDASESNNPLNGKKHTVIYIVAVAGNSGASVANSKYTFDLIVEGTGEFDAWIAAGGAFSKRTGHYERTGLTYMAGDSQHTVSVPATATEVLSVASTVSRNELKNESLYGKMPKIDSLVIGNVSDFSSLGPTVNPGQTGQKPEIAAPGEWVLSALSYDAREKFEKLKMPRSYDFVLLSGTSMAAPHVAGASALLFEKNPALRGQDVKRILCQATGPDIAEAQSPDNRRGYGHLNISRAIQLFDQNPLGGLLPVSTTPVAEIPFTATSSMESLGEISTLLNKAFLVKGEGVAANGKQD